MGNEYYLIVFDSINHANYLESELRRYGYEVDMLQTPEYLSREYNIALKIYEEALEFALEEIVENKLEIYKIYKHYYNNGRRTYRVVKPDYEKYQVDKGCNEDNMKTEKYIVNTQGNVITVEDFIENLETPGNTINNEEVEAEDCTEPAEPTEPTEATEPVIPTETCEAAEPIEEAEPPAPPEEAEPPAPPEEAEPVVPTEACEPVEPTEVNEPVLPVETAEPTESQMKDRLKSSPMDLIEKLYGLSKK